jgi:NYN domain
VDRCALFVDAGYVLGDGAMAVHGTRNRDSVSWDYAGVLQVLGNVARDRTGLPLLRCYWYEATVEGRRTAEHEALADMPGVKLRLGRMRPGHREGVESEIHRDLTTLARNRAISDALVVSAEEGLAQVVSDVQDLGIRVILAYIPVGGAWTVSPVLRQECDDVVEISEAQLRPSVELVTGAGPDAGDEQHAAGAYAERAPANGHGPTGALSHPQGMPAGSQPVPAPIYTGPVIAEYQRAAQPAVSPPAAAASPSGQVPAVSAAGGQPGPVAAPGPLQQGVPGPPQQGQPGPRIAGQHAAHAAHAAQPGPALSAVHGQHELASQHATPAPGQPGASPTVRPYQAPAGLAGQQAEPPPGMSPPGIAQPGLAQPGMAQPGMAQLGGTPHSFQPEVPGRLPAPHDQRPAQQFPPSGPPEGGASGGYLPQQGPHSGPQPGTQNAPPPMGVSLADAVQAAHGEGFTFGQAVARDAPALWLEAVLARKPRMPSDLEARLLQDSSLPIDSLLHDEVRHALRRGFWDALERVRH